MVDKRLGISNFFNRIRPKTISEKKKMYDDLNIRIDKLSSQLRRINNIRSKIIVDINKLKEERNKMYLDIKPYIT